MTGRPARPRIVITFGTPSTYPDEARWEWSASLYREMVGLHGAETIFLDARSSDAERREAFASMDGLLLAGGNDIDPARYGRPIDGAVDLDPDRDQLEADAWAAAESRGLPVLGVCRGMQAVNVFSGGTLIQHVPGHDGEYFVPAPHPMHPLRIVPGTRIARIVSPGRTPGVVEVNAFHHQGVGAADLAPGLVAAGWSPGPSGELVEALEGSGERFVAGVQFHPERTDSTGPEWARLTAFFVGAARGPLR